MTWESSVRDLVHDSLSKVLEIALEERRNGEELSVTALITGNLEKLSEGENFDEEQVSKFLDVHIYIGICVPPVFGIEGKGERLAMVGRERELASAKYSDWVRLVISYAKVFMDFIALVTIGFLLFLLFHLC